MPFLSIGKSMTAFSLGKRQFFFAVLVLAALGIAAAGEMRYLTSHKVAAYFEKARRNESSLIAFLHKMPKGADLHNHPWGAVSAESLLDAAIRQGLYFDREAKAFVQEKPSGPHYGPEEMRGPFWQTAEVLEAISMRNRELSGESGHAHFFRSFYRFAAALEDDTWIYRELFARAISQNIHYLELMMPPGQTRNGPSRWMGFAAKRSRRPPHEEGTPSSRCALSIPSSVSLATWTPSGKRWTPPCVPSRTTPACLSASPCCNPKTTGRRSIIFPNRCA